MDMTVDGISLSSLGIIIESGPTFKKPKRRIIVNEAEGVDGSQSDFIGYDSYSLPFTIIPTDATKFNQIYALLDGPRTIVCSDDPLNYRLVEFNDEIEYDKLATWKKAQISIFVPQPYRYPITDAAQTITAFPATIVNSGTAESTPLLKITGTGTVNITLNGVTFEYTFDTPYVYIDCIKGPTRRCYHEAVTKTRKKTGGWPTLAVGNNTLTVNSGTVTEVVVTKRTRFL